MPLCNALNHFCGCSCGFGPSWNYVPNLFPLSDHAPKGVFYSYGASMRDRAKELGHSLIFPVICRYCQSLIYLFASPNGGFAIFDSLGDDWPKHQCSGISQEKSSYVTIKPIFMMEYDWPIPIGTNVDSPKSGSLIGVVIKSNNCTWKSDLYEIELYDGSVIHKVLSRNSLKQGCYYKGILRSNLHSLIFESILEYQYELKSPHIVISPFLDQILISNLKPQDIWSLQSDAETLNNREPVISKLLVRSLDSLLNGYKLTSAIMLTKLVRASSSHISAKMKARHANTLLRLLEELNLCRAVPAVWTMLSKQTRKLLNPHANKFLIELMGIGSLRAKKELPERSIYVFKNHLEKERKYIDSLNVDEMPKLILEFRTLLLAA